MIIMIDNYDSFTYNIYQQLAEVGHEIAVYRNDALDLDGIIKLAPDRLIISPGPGNPADEFAVLITCSGKTRQAGAPKHRQRVFRRSARILLSN